MSEQMQLLAHLIEVAEKDQDSPTALLREICVTAAQVAPRKDLIKMSKFLLELGTKGE